MQIARLNLMAGKSCIRTASFHSAAEYFTNGIALLPGDCFEHESALSLELNDLAQRVLHMTGNFDRMNSFISRVIANARNFEEMVNSCK